MPPAMFIRITSAVCFHLILLAGTTAEDLLRQAEQKIQNEQFSSAEALLKEALRSEPANTSGLYRLGYVQYRQRKLDEARRNFSAVVKTVPPAYHSRYFLGRIALLDNKHSEAIKWLEPIVESKQAVFDAASQLAAAYAGAGFVGKATGALRAAVAQAPWDAALYYRLAQLYAQSGHKELAGEAFENNRRLRNTSREDVETLMRTSQFISEGNRVDGLRAGARIRDRKDADPNALVALGVIYGNGNMQAEALDAFSLAADRDPQLFAAQLNRGLALLKLNRASESLMPLATAVELLPQSTEANVTYGLASVMNQRYAQAVEPLERVWGVDSSNLRVGALLATSYLRTGAAAKAVSVLRNEAFRSSNDPAPQLLLVEALNAAEDPNAALDAAREAQKQFPKLPQVQMAVAQQLARLGRYQEARPAFEETLKLTPGHPEAELGMGDSLQKSGDHAAALNHYRAAMKSERTDAAALTGLVRSLVALRQLEEARQLLEAGILKHPSNAALRIELSRVYARLGKSDLAAEQATIADRLRAEQPSP